VIILRRNHTIAVADDKHETITFLSQLHPAMIKYNAIREVYSEEELNDWERELPARLGSVG
jgi:hypothetical protein